MAKTEDIQLLRVDEAAERMHCSRSHIYNLVNSGELCSVKFGGAVRIPSSCIDSPVQEEIEKWKLSRKSNSALKHQI